MKMYIANCTPQVQDFHYRLPENAKLLKQTIPLGQQIQIPGDLTQFDIDAIIEQHSRYGMVRVGEIDRTKAFIGVCYDIDRKVDMDRVRNAIEHNYEVLEERGKIIRQEAAVAVNNSIEEQTGGGLNALEARIEEVGKDATMDETIRGTTGRRPSRTRRAA